MFHIYITNLISTLLDQFYYRYVQIVYKDELKNILHYATCTILKLEYFIYAQYYFNYLFFYHISKKNRLLLAICLHLTYICSLLYHQLAYKYNYVSAYNILFLEKSFFVLFSYLLFLKILYASNVFYEKIYLWSTLFLFQLLAYFFNYLIIMYLKSNI